MTTNNDQPILVLGASGKTGRRVAARLESRDLAVRRGSRSGTPPFDWEDPSTWPAVVDGVGKAYISYYPDLAVPGAGDAVGGFAELAVRHGLRRLVLLAGRGEAAAEEAEDAVRASGIPELTVVRATWFAQNFSEDYLLDAILDGVVALPAGDTPEPFVDADDIADVAVAALTEDGHAGETYVLTGPRALSFAQAVSEIGAATGRDLRYVPITVAEYAAEAARHGVPEEVVGLLTYLFSEVLDGRNTPTEDGVRRALGRAPRDFSAFARDVAATGLWNPARDRA
ncbi:MAG TPA: NmrA family transcriptional regulator [Baekduia sp.]|nr:NmrA family transcriptional regulator [Baekduia sp.]